MFICMFCALYYMRYYLHEIVFIKKQLLTVQYTKNAFNTQ